MRAILLAAAFCASSSADIVYHVLPEDLGSGYSVSGTFTTQNSLITAYNLVVNGPTPYTFTESSPSAFNVGFSVGQDGIEVAQNLATVGAQDNSHPDCLACQQTLSWTPGEIRYRHLDFLDTQPNVLRTRIRTGPIAVIPEPSAFALSGLAIFCLGGFLMWKSYRPRRQRMSCWPR